jgi:drug/metabolite transporter (DMT)-like permease
MKAIMTLLTAILPSVVSHLLIKPLDVWAIAAWILLVLSVAGVVFFIHFSDEEATTTVIPKTRPFAKVGGRGEAPPTVHKSTWRSFSTSGGGSRHTAAPAGRSSVVKGFVYVLAAALCWSISNILLRITALKLPSATFDIAVLNYLVASVALIASAWVISRVRRQPFRLPPLKSVGKFWLVAAANGLNTYAWILSVGIISAASAATLEGLHVVFTVLLLVGFFRVKVPTSNWLTFVTGSMVLVAGAILILGVPTAGPGFNTWLGIALGALSGFFFSAFYVLWDKVGAKPTAGARLPALLIFLRKRGLGSCFLVEVNSLTAALKALW